MSPKSNHEGASEIAVALRSGQNIALIARPNSSVSSLMRLALHCYTQDYGDHALLYRPVDARMRPQKVPEHLGLDVLVDDALAGIELFANGLCLDRAHAVCAFLNTPSLTYVRPSWEAAFNGRRLDRVIEIPRRGEFVEHPVSSLPTRRGLPYVDGYVKTHTSYRRLS